MSKLSDQEIQYLLDQQVSENVADSFADNDFDRYRAVFKELDKMPPVILPFGFSVQVMKRLEENKSSRRSLAV
jgi:hypothetical protein